MIRGLLSAFRGPKMVIKIYGQEHPSFVWEVESDPHLSAGERSYLIERLREVIATYGPKFLESAPPAKSKRKFFKLDLKDAWMGLYWQDGPDGIDIWICPLPFCRFYFGPFKRPEVMPVRERCTESAPCCDKRGCLRQEFIGLCACPCHDID